MKIWGNYTSLVYWWYWVELPFICKSIVEAWNWKCSHNKWSSQLNLEDFKNINDGLIYRNISWLSLKKRNVIFYFSWPFKRCTCRSSSSDITNYPFPLIDKIPCSASLKKKSLMKYLLLHKIFMDLFGLVFWPQDISPLLYPGPVVHPQEFGSHSFCPRALFLPAPCQYFSINASEQMSIFLLLNLYLLLASISGNIQERGTYLWWYELHIEHNGFHDYHAHPSDTIYVHSRISEGVQSSELCFWQHRTQSWLHVYCSTWLHYISQLLGWWNIV